MRLTNQTFSNWKSIKDKTPMVEVDNYLTRMRQQGKRVSQIIAYIWLHIDRDGADGETARKLDQYFKQGGGQLEKLLCAQLETEEFKLLQQVFTKDEATTLTEPIFNETESQYYDFEVAINEFRSSLEDPPVGEKVFRVSIPYPPRPEISEQNGTLTREELKDWIKSDSNDINFPADNPFIPSTCS